MRIVAILSVILVIEAVSGKNAWDNDSARRDLEERELNTDKGTGVEDELVNVLDELPQEDESINLDNFSFYGIVL